jgi:hypothetical protein
MPTVLRSGRFRVMSFVPPREHGPPHVHVYKGGEGTVVVLLGREHQLPAIRDVVDVGPRDVARALRIVRAHAEYLRERWRKIHGE